MTNRRKILLGAVAAGIASVFAPLSSVSGVVSEITPAVTRPVGLPLKFLYMFSKFGRHAEVDVMAFSIDSADLEGYTSIEPLLEIVRDEADTFTDPRLEEYSGKMTPEIARGFINICQNVIARDTRRGRGNRILLSDNQILEDKRSNTIDFDISEPFYTFYQTINYGNVKTTVYDGLILSKVENDTVYYALHPEWKKYVKRIIFP